MKLKRFIMTFLILISLVTLASCSGFFTEEVEAIQIASITNEKMEDGNIKITISYTDPTKRPDEFIIPKGDDGVIGIGIKDVVTEKSEDGTSTTLTITYTDDSIEPTTFTLKDGVSVLGVETLYKEEENETYMVINFSDGTKKELVLPKGEKGDDGNGIASWDVVTNDDDSVTITFNFTKTEEPFIITIPAPKKGNGIDSITSTEENGKYVLIIKYTDANMEDKRIEFDKPAEPNKWLSGIETPYDDMGDNGDYYMDTYHKKIYHKENGSWVEVVSFDNTNIIYTISFNLNDSDDPTHPAKFPQGSYHTYKIKSGTYFQDLINPYGGAPIPIPTREGYTFGGWYRVPNPTVNNAAFTDLTPVLSDLTLYAKWIKD